MSEAEQLAAECLAAMHAAGHTGARSVTVDPRRLKGGYICGTVRVTVTWDPSVAAVDAPPTLVVKMEEPHSNDHDVALELRLYEREWHFYETMSALVAPHLRCPKYYGTISRAGAKCAVVMEDLELLGHPSSNPPISVSVLSPKMDAAAIKSTVTAAARMHATFFRKDDELLRLGVMRLNGPAFQPSWASRVGRQWPAFREKWAAVLSADALAAGDRIVRHFQAVQNHLATPPCTFVHGDIKPGNMFMLDAGTPAFIDWQYTAVAKGVCDILFFLVEGFDEATCAALEPAVLADYYSALVAAGVEGYSEAELRRDWAFAAMHFPMYVSLWFGSVPDDKLVDPSFPKRFVPRTFATIMRLGAHTLLPE